MSLEPPCRGCGHPERIHMHFGKAGPRCTHIDTADNGDLVICTCLLWEAQKRQGPVRMPTVVMDK